MKPLALITGASSGIGETFARALAARGYGLILVARRQERLEKLAAELGGAEVLAADLADDAQLKRVEDRIAAEPALELLVNNAGFGTRGRFWEADLESQDRMHRLHVIAIMRLTHAALAGMTARGRGAIINVSSVAGFIQNAGNTSYSATKCWINSFTEGLWLELKTAGSPVRIQALCPGFTFTDFHDVMGVDRSSIPGPLWMRAEDVVQASLRGLDRGKLFVVPGLIYKAIVAVVPALPRFVRTPLVLRYSRRRGKN
ncbi:MAG: SDR family NAD(P)-dependent oxidoreductase [Acidobacteriota bacterium]